MWATLGKLMGLMTLVSSVPPSQVLHVHQLQLAAVLPALEILCLPAVKPAAASSAAAVLMFACEV